MTYYCADVKKFHDKFDLVTPSRFVFLEPSLADFRLRFFLEEFEELKSGYEERSVAECVDALIDLVYITCGAALLHGISPSDFGLMAENASFDPSETITIGSTFETPGPQLMPPTKQRILHSVLQRHIEGFQDSTATNNEQGIRHALTGIYVNSLFASSEMNFTTDQWDELWNDVQRANMSKVRATDPSASKRGSAWDVVKPIGWVPPRTEELVAKFIAEAS